MNPLEYDISVRELAEFVHRRGNLGDERTFRRSNRAFEGIKGHKRIQQSRGTDYRPEVLVERSFVRGEVGLRVIGRVDGVVDGLTPLVEEIKTVEAGRSCALGSATNLRGHSRFGKSLATRIASVDLPGTRYERGLSIPRGDIPGCSARIPERDGGRMVLLVDSSR